MPDARQVLSNLEFLTVAQFLRYVETEARLEEFSTEAVYSFQVVPKGLDALLKRKKKLLKTLNMNNQKLAEWVELYHPQGDAKEKAVLRSLYYQTRISIQIVSKHVEAAEDLILQALLSKEETNILKEVT